LLLDGVGFSGEGCEGTTARAKSILEKPARIPEVTGERSGVLSTEGGTISSTRK